MPGCVHTDLLSAGKINDPFYRDEELHLQWIGERSWIYSRSFTLSPDARAHDRILLVCKGLDTFARVTVNGKRVAQTDNQFRTWTFDVTELLKKGRNTLAVQFDSPLLYQKKRVLKRPLQSPAHVPHSWPGQAYVRKSPCNYGWV